MLNFKEFEPSAKKTGTLRGLSDLFEGDAESLPKEMVKLAEEYGKEKQAIRSAENEIKARKKKQAEKEEKLFAMLEAAGIETFGTGEYTYYKRVDSYPSIANEKMAHKWIKEEGFGDIIKLAVNLRSLGSVIKEVFETTGEMPGEEDGINIRTVKRVGVRKR